VLSQQRPPLRLCLGVAPLAFGLGRGRLAGLLGGPLSLVALITLAVVAALHPQRQQRHRHA
jgi:hypothetical protein